jgi:hypothetical protein
MEASPGPSQYEYEPLPDPGTHIRLLQIPQCHADTTLHCRFTSWRLTEAPRYHAISYTWGDPELTTNILINQRNMIVRSNCEYALRQAHAASPGAYIWIDAICINQEDSEEKGHQVAIMATFYRQATSILACVGPHSQNSEHLFKLLVKHEEYLRRKHKKLKKYSAHRDTSGWALQVWGLRSGPTFKFLGSRIGIMQTVTEFLSRPYFSRLWILQELYMGNGRITVCCGMDRQSLNLLFVLCLRAWQWFIYYRNLLFKLPAFVAKPIMIRYDELLNSSSMTHASTGLLLGAGVTVLPSPLYLVLYKVEYFQCENQRDKLYGALGLVDWGKDPIPAPDYRKDVFELVKDIIDILLVWKPRETPWEQHSLLDVAEDMLRIFSVGREHGALRNAIALRNESRLGSSMSPIRLEYLRYADVSWRGVKLSMLPHKTNSSPNSRLYVHTLEESDPLHIEITHEDRTPFAYAPISTRAGDWILLCSRYPDRIHVFSGLVLRPQSDDTYSIIGPAFTANLEEPHTAEWRPWWEALDSKVFKIWWYPEDILVLASVAQLNDRFLSISRAEMDEWLQMRICASPESTLIMGPYDFGDIDRDHKAGNYAAFKEPENC